MLTRAVTTITKSTLWLLVFAMALGGCAKSTAPDDAATTATTEAAPLTDFPLIPREVLFGNPERTQARISPDGKWLSFLAPAEGVMNVWVGPVDDVSAAEPVTEETVRPIPQYNWAYDSQHILYPQDADGNEDFHLHATDVETRQTKDLTPIDGVRAQLQELSRLFPNEILVGLNDRDPRLHDIWRINIETGERELIEQNHGVAAHLTDDNFRVRIALRFTPTGGQLWQLSEGEGDQRTWKDFQEFGAEDSMTSSPAGFDAAGETFYYVDTRGRNTAGLFAMDLGSGEAKLLAENDKADADGVVAHPTEKHIQAVSFTYARTEWEVLDDAIAPDFEFLQDIEDGDMVIASRSLDDTRWIVGYTLDNGPVKYYYYIRSPERKARFLFNDRDNLSGYPLVKMHTPVIESRDGLDLVCYLSLPPGSDPDGDGRPREPLPTVLFVHGGPWARDKWGLNPYHQWLANRGYAVLSVNYRGSTGFGKEFINAANGEWAGKMHDDLLDAVEWAIDEQIAIADKVAIAGGSYGGYATLVGLTFTPDVFACGVDIVGPSSLVTLLQNVPDYWVPFMPIFKTRLADVETAAGRAELLKRSPLTRVNQIRRPLLIGQGANDPRVTQLEADQIVAAMTEHKIPVTYVLYPDEGHGFRRPENKKSFNAVAEAFLAEQLGGRFEPVGDDFRGATISVPTGADEVPGLPEALKSLPEVASPAAGEESAETPTDSAEQ